MVEEVVLWTSKATFMWLIYWNLTKFPSRLDPNVILLWWVVNLTCDFANWFSLCSVWRVFQLIARFARFLLRFGEDIVNQKFICLIWDAAMHSFLLPMAELNRMNELLVYSEQTGTLFLGKSLGPLGIGKIAFVWVPNKYSLDFFFPGRFHHF